MRLLLALAVGWLLAPAAWAQSDSEAEVARASLVQVRLWLDLGEQGKAVALTRRGVKLFEADPLWHLHRLRALHAAGMDAWIDVEYGGRDEGLDPVRAQAFAAWQVEAGRRLALPEGVGGSLADPVRASLALVRGDPAAAQEVAARGGESGRALAVELHLAAGDQLALADLLSRWPEDGDEAVPLAPLAAVLRLKAGRELRAAQELIWARVDRRIAEGTSPLALLDTAELLLELGRDGGADRLARLADHVVAVFGAPDLQRQMNGMARGPGRWTEWEVPWRPRWSASELEAEAVRLAKEGSIELPWTRPEERRLLAGRLAELLEADGKLIDADRVRLRHTGTCAWSRLPEALVAQGKRREGRAAAEDLLFRCLGGTDLTPDRDPANLDVDREADELAGAWYRFGLVADLGHWFEDAALAYGLAARLQPDPDRVALAASRAKAVGFDPDRTGVPAVEALLARMEQAPWLDPPQALQRSRALRGKARTAALLQPLPARLAARALPEDLCVPTLRARCETERAVAVLAAARAGQPAPAGLEPPADRGADKAAARWLERLDQLWFARGAGLAHAAKSGGVSTLAEILAAETGLRVGRPAPDWTAGSIRAVDLRGKVVVLTFWGSWCRRCLAQLPMVDAAAARWSAEGLPVRVVAVSVDEDEDDYRKALGRLAWGTLGMVRDDLLRRRFRAEELPTTVIIDAGGVVRDHRAGYPDTAWLDEAVRPWAALASRGTGG